MIIDAALSSFGSNSLVDSRSSSWRSTNTVVLLDTHSVRSLKTLDIPKPRLKQCADEAGEAAQYD
jgi:hypothetical protein